MFIAKKPLTLTIEEGKQICKVTKETGRVFQVGTQQRSEMGQKFLTAIGIIREGRIGKIKKVTCNIGGGPKGGPFKKSDPLPISIGICGSDKPRLLITLRNAATTNSVGGMNTPVAK